MSFASLLTHSLALVTPTQPDPDDVDGYGEPLPGPDIVVLMNGLVQPKTAKEMAHTLEQGTEISTHVVFLLPMEIEVGSYIRDQPDTGRRFQVRGVRSFEYGQQSPHLEVDVFLVGSTEGPGVGS